KAGSSDLKNEVTMSLPVHANANANVDRKVLQYENFINEVLKRDLQKVLEQRDSVYEKISQYLQLKNTIQTLQLLYFTCVCVWCGCVCVC
uniref:Uncharacterized protein n=1 Tax=Labrus bergylta TaxID=56723 RepID=A0A3Q3FZK2_9LABR